MNVSHIYDMNSVSCNLLSHLFSFSSGFVVFWGVGVGGVFVWLFFCSAKLLPVKFNFKILLLSNFFFREILFYD